MNDNDSPLPRRPIPRPRQPLTWDLVRRRNSVERIKHEKHPLQLLEELPQLARRPYEEIPEEDILRLQWLGLYHDKPKTGEFMLRVKIPGGRISAAQLREVGRISRRWGRDSGEITTRQDLQLHWIRLAEIPRILERLGKVGLSTTGACGDILRNITSCPVSGIDPEELFDTGPVLQELASFFQGNREYADLPRKHKWTVSACPYHCNAPEIHDVALVGTRQQGREGFAVWVGGGLSSAPRLARPLGVFLRPREALPVLRAILDLWRGDLTYRRSRVKARFKFMVDDHGPEGILKLLQERLGRRLTPLLVSPQPRGRTDHMGIHGEKEPGRVYIGFPVLAGLLSGTQMEGVAAVVERWGREIRFTREQNLILSGVEREQVKEVVQAMADLGIPLEVHPLRGHSIACTGNPHCNFAVGDTKPRLQRLVRHLEERFGSRVAGLRIYLDGCPHACGQHWVGDIGIQGTTLRQEGERLQAYDILLRGSLGREAAIARPVARRVPSQELEEWIGRLLEAYFSSAGPARSFPSFCRALSDEELLAIMAGQGREEEIGPHT